MRPATIAIVGGISFVVLLVITVLLFWFAAPRWQPELVMRYSPSLWHVIKALSYYENPGGYRYFSISAKGASTIIYKDETHSLKRFQVPYGDKFYAALAATDDGTNPKFSTVIVSYFGDQVHEREARKILWQYREKGNRQARDILYGHASSVPQRISPPERMPDYHRK
jgi:hypothetical protein